MKGIEMEMNGNPHFLLVVSNPVAKKNYLERLDTIGATYKIIEKQEELDILQRQDGYNGIMLDVHSVLKLSGQHRNIIKEYCYALPTLKLFFHSETNNLVINHSNLDDLTVNNLEDFVETCARLPARQIRRDQRFNIFLNVTMYDQLTHITDISRRGSFILTTERSLKVGDEISIEIVELSDKTPLRCIIRRKVEWGNKYQAAGAGIEFISMTATQRSELDAVLRECKERMGTILSKWDEFLDDPGNYSIS